MEEFSFGEHLEELRARIISCLLALFGAIIVCFADQNFYMELVLKPHSQAMQALGQPTTIQVLRYEESFFGHLKVSVIVALILTMPFIFYQIWLFISIGLYSKEKKYIMTFFPFALFFFFFGVTFGYFVLIPLGLRFLAGYGNMGMIHIGITLSSYISLFFILTFVSGIIFELPLVMLFLNKLGMLKTEFFIEHWRYSVLVAFVTAALLTPPDVVTQLLMAFPIVVLYFSGILLCRFSDRLTEIRRFVNT